MESAHQCHRRHLLTPDCCVERGTPTICIEMIKQSKTIEVFNKSHNIDNVDILGISVNFAFQSRRDGTHSSFLALNKVCNVVIFVLLRSEG